MPLVVTLSVDMLNVIMLSVAMLNVIMLSVVMLNFVMPSATVPCNQLYVSKKLAHISLKTNYIF